MFFISSRLHKKFLTCHCVVLLFYYYFSLCYCFIAFRYDLMTMKYNIKIGAETQTPFRLHLGGSSKFILLTNKLFKKNFVFF